MSPDETRRVLAVATSLKARVALSLCYGCGLRAGEVVRLKVKHIDSAQKIIRIEQSKGRKDRNVMLSPEIIDLLRRWWKARRGFDAHTTPLQERWLFPGRRPGMPMTTRQLNRLFHEAADDWRRGRRSRHSPRRSHEAGRRRSRCSIRLGSPHRGRAKQDKELIKKEYFCSRARPARLRNRSRTCDFAVNGTTRYSVGSASNPTRPHALEFVASSISTK
jgi:integrase